VICSFGGDHLEPSRFIPASKYRKTLKNRILVSIPYNRRNIASLEDHMNFWIIAGLVIYPTFAQIQHGSVGVVYLTKDKIIMAADSRGMLSRDNIPDNAECKIATPERKIMFLTTGISGYVPDGPASKLRRWSSIDEVNKACRSVTAKYGMGEAMVAGFGGGQTLIMFRVRLNLDTADKATPVKPKIDQVECPASTNYFCAQGRPEVAIEFSSGMSQRAKDEARTWTPPTVIKADQDILRTIRLIELTIKYVTDGSVGGPIDAAELSSNGTLRWYVRKPNCPEK
jgi:hypothetical protein